MSPFIRKIGRKLGRSDESGFTLVELLIVMIILMTLAGIAIMSSSGTDEGAQLTSMMSDARTAVAAEESYYTANKSYATATADASSSDTAVRQQLGSSNIYIVASPHNKVEVTSTTCGNGQPGFTVQVTSSLVPSKRIFFDSCTSAGIEQQNASP